MEGGRKKKGIYCEASDVAGQGELLCLAKVMKLRSYFTTVGQAKELFEKKVQSYRKTCGKNKEKIFTVSQVLPEMVFK